jgi:hypothetical protein
MLNEMSTEVGRDYDRDAQGSSVGEGTQMLAVVEVRESSDGYILEVCLKAALPSA